MTSPINGRSIAQTEALLPPLLRISPSSARLLPFPSHHCFQYLVSRKGGSKWKLIKKKICALWEFTRMSFHCFSFSTKRFFSYVLSNKFKALTYNLLALGFKVNSVTDFHHTLENLFVCVFFSATEMMWLVETGSFTQGNCSLCH